ncbi:ras and Rab interactor 2 isoform X2 [Genypterus blacodes]|uniref:ras and Rab interactor 2 isoform X2 n=1 Tax=Genypterus blacodes TaxID=154954 RepID=UPI003F76C736
MGEMQIIAKKSKTLNWQWLSFLVVRDCETLRPSLLCVSAGRDGKAADYHIKSTGAGFQLSESRLKFSDLAQLVLFYSLTRDVLAVCLSIPHWIYNVTEQNKYRLSELGPTTWLCPPADLLTDQMTRREPNTVMCTIQLTSANGALCVINPLYVLEHGDDLLTRRPTSLQCATQPSNYRREGRLGSTRSWTGAGLQTKRTISLDQEPPAATSDVSGLNRVHSADSSRSPPAPSASPVSGDVVLRRPSREFTSMSPSRPVSQGILPSSSPSAPGSFRSASSDPQRHSSPVPQSPHRVSWIEDGVWCPPPRPSSLLPRSSLELDSLSISSIEEEPDSPAPSPAPHHASTHKLAGKVINRLSAMGQVLGGLVCQKKKLINRVQELSERRGLAFAEAVRGFVETTLRTCATPGEVTVTELLQEVRSSLTLLRETLFDYPEIQTALDSMTDFKDSEIDSLVELSLHKVALKPVSSQLYSCIQTTRTNDGSLPHLQRSQRALEGHGVEELGGSEGVGVPDLVTLERMQQRWSSMHDSYSPNKKVQILLKVCKSVYHSMSANASPDKVFGADDFLPCLTWVLLRSDVATLQLDTDYMMELLDPMQLQGEGGYYLTSLYASLYYISSFRPRLVVRQVSAEAQQSINQWHRRRTLHCNQSRRNKHRQTIRRQTCRDQSAKNSEEKTRGKKGHEESGKEDEDSSVEAVETDDGTNALESVREETVEGRAEEPQQMSDPLIQQEVRQDREENTQRLCTEEQGGGGGGVQEREEERS